MRFSLSLFALTLLSLLTLCVAVPLLSHKTMVRLDRGAPASPSGPVTVPPNDGDKVNTPDYQRYLASLDALVRLPPTASLSTLHGILDGVPETYVVTLLGRDGDLVPKERQMPVFEYLLPRIPQEMIDDLIERFLHHNDPGHHHVVSL